MKLKPQLNFLAGKHLYIENLFRDGSKKLQGKAVAQESLLYIKGSLLYFLQEEGSWNY